MAAWIGLVVVEAYIAGFGLALAWLSSRRDHLALRRRINQYGVRS